MSNLIKVGDRLYDLTKSKDFYEYSKLEFEKAGLSLEERPVDSPSTEEDEEEWQADFNYQKDQSTSPNLSNSKDWEKAFDEEAKKLGLSVSPHNTELDPADDEDEEEWQVVLRPHQSAPQKIKNSKDWEKAIDEDMSKIGLPRIPKATENIDKQKTIAVDFDNVLYDNKEYGDGTIQGEPMLDAVQVMTVLKQSGYNLVIFTTRLNPQFDGDIDWKREQIANWLIENNIPFDEITNNKPKAVAYIDNKAIPFTKWSKILKYFGIKK